MSTAVNITAEGLVYAGKRRRCPVDEDLQLFSSLLSGQKRARTFNAITQGLKINWSLHEDIVNPLGDKRQAAVTVFTFDLDSDVLFFSDATQDLQIPISRFRERPTPNLNVFTTFKPTDPPGLDHLAFPSPYWIPARPISSRVLPFTTRVLSDFGHQWRHVLRRPYSDFTFRQFSRAVLCVAQLDVKIAEESSRWLHTSERGPFVWIHDRPAWDPCNEHIFRLGQITVVLDQDLSHALTLVRSKIADRGKSKDAAVGLSNMYLLLSMRHIILCHVDEKGIVSYSAPAILLDGINQPSSAAMLLLSQSISFAFAPPPVTPVHKLPIELQNRILELVSQGSVEAARLGCLLELGTPFKWMRTDNSRRGGAIERHQSHTHRSDLTPVDSKVYFGEVFSGLAYR